jgi:hypothetical protein
MLQGISCGVCSSVPSQDTGTYELPFFAFGLERRPRQSTSWCILRLRPDVVAETARRSMADIQRATIG